MAGKKQQTHAKRARELAIKERRERKQAKRSESAEDRAASRAAAHNREDVPGDEGQHEVAPEWIR